MRKIFDIILLECFNITIYAFIAWCFDRIFDFESMTNPMYWVGILFLSEIDKVKNEYEKKEANENGKE